MAIRNHVVVYVNGNRKAVHGSDCFATLSDFLRQRLGLIGTKVVCAEGDCGSCTVLVGRPDGGRLRYRPIDSCIRFMFQLDAAHVVTIEGVAQDGELTAIQQSMVECHGSQCGFCTPGFVMAMTGTLEEHDVPPGDDLWRRSLTGNLCRCTGYTMILEAGRRAAARGVTSLQEIYPPGAILKDLQSASDDTLDLCDGAGTESRRAYCPTSLAEAITFRKENPQAKVVAGATDVGVQFNKRTIAPAVFLDLNRVAEIEGARIEAHGAERWLVAGARATWTEVLDVCRAAVPQLAGILSVFGSPQIRHVGTLGGNIVNASPIADSLPFLCVMDAQLQLVGAAGARQVGINDFYRGYKEFDLRPDELLASVRVALPEPNELFQLYKVSRRRDLDISTFTAAVRMRVDGGLIASAALAYGAVGPTVGRLRRTEQFLCGQRFDADTMQRAGEVAVAEIAPISDVRGSADYRYQLARNVLLKFYCEQRSPDAGSKQRAGVF